MRQRTHLLIILGVTLGLAILNQLAAAPALRIATGLALLLVPTGWAATRLFALNGPAPVLDGMVFSAGFSLLLNQYAYLALQYLHRPVTAGVLRVSIVGLVAVLVLAAMMSKPAPAKAAAPRVGWRPLAILGVAAFFRLAYLGYSEFQGDEAGNCVGTALGLIRGNFDALFVDRRPPAQVLVTAATHLLTGSLDEAVLRLPFALAGLGAVWLVFRIGAAVAGRGAGLVAQTLAALCGLLIVFSRIVQYQSLVGFAALLSACFLIQFLGEEGEDGQPRHLLAGAAFFGFGLLAHYEGLLLGPAFLYALAVRPRRGPGRPWLALGGAVLILAALWLLFFGPFLSNAAFRETVTHYQERRYDGSLHFNEFALRETAPLYNTRLYVPLLVLLALPAFAGRRRPRGEWFVLIWFAVPFLWYMVVSRLPKTHIYTFFIPWTLLAGIGWARISGRLRAGTEPRRGALAGWLAGLFAVACLAIAGGLFQRYIVHRPEYLWNRKLNEIEHNGVFGFPYHRGWKTVGELFESRRIQGPYATNERSNIPEFYLGQPPVKPAQARTLLLVSHPHYYRNKIPTAGAWLRARIEFGGKTTIEIYTREGPAGAAEIIQGR